MSTISDQLTLLNNTKTAIRTAINNKGGSVEASAPFASYATAITNLPSGGDDSALRDLIERDITSITIPSGTTRIGNHAFSYCSSLTSVTIPNSVTEIGNGAFVACSSMASVQIPNGVTNIGNSAFQGSGLSSITMPNTVTTVGTDVFKDCTHLASVKLSSGFSTLQGSMFSGCTGLTTVTIPSTITNIASRCFSGCTGLQSIICLGTTPPTLQNTNAFSNTNDCPIYVPAASVDTYKAADNWRNYASRIVAIAQVATVDGNPVYNYEIGVTDISSTLTDLQVSALPSGDVLEFAEGVTGMQGQIGGYEEVILPSTFTSFADTQPINAATTTLTCKATTPPVVERNNLGGSGLTEIYVPAASVDTYKADTAWSSFASIIQAIPVQEHALFAPPPQTAVITEDPYDDLWWLTFPLKIYYSDGTEMTDTYYRINSQGQGVARNWTPSLTGILDDPNGDLADVVPDGGQFTPVYDSTNGWTMKYEFSICLNDPSDPSPLVGQTVTFSTPIGGMELPADYAEVDGTWVQVRDQEYRSGSFTVTITGIERS